MVIDIHTHCYPDQLAEAAIQNWQTLAGTDRIDGTLSGLLSDLDRAGIDRAVVLHVAHRPGSAHNVNDFAAAVQRAHPDRLRCFGSVHPDASDVMAEIRRIKELGLAGIKLHPLHQNFAPTDPHYYAFYQALSEAGLPVLFHCGSRPGRVGTLQPVQLAAILPHLQGIPIIAAHLGGLASAPEQLSVLVDLPVYVDLSYCARYFEPAAYVHIISALDDSRILFGSDTPWDMASYELRWLEEAGLSSQTMEKILFLNASQLLDWPM